MKINIHRSGSGLPCVWEGGGGYTSTGGSTVVANPDGTPKKPIFVYRRGRACGGHALLVVHEGDVVIKVSRHRGDFTIWVYQVEEIGEDAAEVSQVAKSERGRWTPELPERFRAAVNAAMDKSLCYHCREPHYVVGASHGKPKIWEQMR